MSAVAEKNFLFNRSLTSEAFFRNAKVYVKRTAVALAFVASPMNTLRGLPIVKTKVSVKRCGMVNLANDEG